MNRTWRRTSLFDRT